MNFRSGWVFLLVGLAMLRGFAAAPGLSIQPTATGLIELGWAEDPPGFVLEEADSLGGQVRWREVALTPTRAGGRYAVRVSAGSQTRFYRLRQVVVPLVRVESSSPGPGERGVAVTRETILRLSGALAPDTVLDVNRISARADGRRLLSRAELSGDRRTVTLFYLENLPSDSRVEVTFDGTGVFSSGNVPVDLDGDGVVGGALRLAFETVSTTALSTTGVEGRVYASEKNPDGTDRPLKNVIITVDGQEETLRTTTDATGFFRLVPSPAGRFFVSVDGRSAEGSQWPGGAYYPFVGKAWEATPGRTNNPAGGSGVIYLPLIQADALQVVSGSSETRVTFAPSVLATNPALSGVEVTVPANALFADNGVRGGRVGIAPVAPDRLPEPLPLGLNLPLVITIQTDGARNFDQPVPVTFPNLPDPVTGVLLGPGEKTGLWSFNHDTGRWELQGTMTISADGRFAVSDPGVGVRQPGWHGVGQGGPGGGPGGPDGPDGPEGPDGPDDCDGPNCDEEEKRKNPCDDKAALVFFSLSDLVLDTAIEASGGIKNPTAGCVVGGVLNAARSARDCSLQNSKDCLGTIDNNAKGAMLGCVPVVGGWAGVAWGVAGLIDNVFNWYDCTQNFQANPAGQAAGASVGTGGNAVPAVLAEARQLLEKQMQVVEVLSRVVVVTCGDAVWNGAKSPADALVYRALFEEVQRAGAVGSPGGNLFTAEERAVMEAMPLPAGVGVTHLRALLDRFERIGSGETPADQALRDSIAAVNGELVAVVQPLEAAGWERLTSGLEKALALLSSLTRGGEAPEFAGGGGSAGAAAAVAKRAGAGGAEGEPKMYRFPRRSLFFRLVNLSNGFEVRGRLNSAGLFDNLMLAPTTSYLVQYFDAATGRVGEAYFRSAASGLATQVPACLMFEPRGVDADRDGLSDRVERVLGTSTTLADTDGDGIRDGVEVSNGLDPSDNQPPGLGVVATRDLPGTSVEVDTADDLAFVAASDAGIAVFSVENPMTPVLLSRVAPPTGVFDAVATAGDFVVAVPGVPTATSARVYVYARGGGGVLAPVGNVPVGAVPETVVAAGRYAYAPGRAANLPTVAVIRLADARVMNQVPMVGGVVATSLLVDGDVLWALGQTRLNSYRIVGDTLEPLGGVALSGMTPAPLEPGLELGGGNGRLYVGAFSGFRVIDSTNPALPVTLSAGGGTQLAVHDLSANGSGLLLPVTSFAGTTTLALSAYGVGDDRSTNFLTSFSTPGDSRAVVLHRGFALVADGAQGLATVNFLSPDRGTNPPSISLRAYPTVPPDAQEASELFFVSTTTTDDVQVRDVEFFVDGVLVARSGRFPFSATLRAPPRVEGKTRLVVRARATDTGGNSAWSQEVVLALVPDSTPPRLLAVTPAPNTTLARGSVSSLGAVFDSVMDAESVRRVWTLRGAGDDGRFGTGDDLPLTGGTTELNASTREVAWRLGAPLLSGKYQASLGSGATDLGGNPVGTNLTWEFSIPSPRVVAVTPADRTVLESGSLREVQVRFDERLSPSSVTPSTVLLLSTNAVNPVALGGGVASVSEDGRGAVLTFPQGVPDGAYRIAATPGIRDVYGSPVETNLTGIIHVKGPTLWLSDTNGAWELGRNWSIGTVPLFGDLVVIDRPTVSVTVSLASNPQLGTLRSAEGLALNGRRLGISRTAELSGPLRWNGRGTLAGGEIMLRGETVVAGGGSGSPSSGSTFFANAARVESGVVRNSGRIEVHSGIWEVAQTNALFENMPGGVIRLAPTNRVFIEQDRILGTRGSGVPPFSRFVNRGLMEGLPDGRNWRFHSIEFENLGEVRWPDSVLEVESSRLRTGPLSVIDVRRLTLTHADGVLEGEVRARQGLAFTNNGPDAVLTLGNGPFDFGTNGITIYGGTLRVVQPVTSEKLQTFSVNSRLALEAPLTVSGSAVLRLDRVDGNGQLRLMGTSLYGPPTSGGGVGVFRAYGTASVQNFGSLQISNSQAVFYEGSTLINQPGAEMVVMAGGSIQSSTIPSSFRPGAVGTNYGRIRRLGTGSSVVHLANAGRVEVESGYAQFYGGSHTGTFEVAAGSTLEVSRGALEPGSVVSGEGTLVLDSTARGRLDVRRVDVERVAAFFDGDHRLRELEAGDIKTSGRLEVTERFVGATVRLQQGVLRLLTTQTLGGALLSDGVTLENGGQLTLTGLVSGQTIFRSSSGRWVNLSGGVLTLTGNGRHLNPFVNLGRVIKAEDSALEFVNGIVTNAGVIEVTRGLLAFASGLTNLPGGEVRLMGGRVALFELQGGVLTGSGTNSSTVFINSGVVQPGLPLGVLRVGVGGRFEQGTNGVLEIEVGGLVPGVGHDQVVAEGSLRLAGTLRLSVVNGFTPQVGQDFVILTGTQISGGTRFRVVEGTVLGDGKRFDVVYETNRVVLKCVASL